jgi:hypothetical protein
VVLRTIIDFGSPFSGYVSPNVALVALLADGIAFYSLKKGRAEQDGTRTVPETNTRRVYDEQADASIGES